MEPKNYIGKVVGKIKDPCKYDADMAKAINKMSKNETENEKLLILAEKIARKAHKGQFRDDGKTPYITHPKAVVEEFVYKDNIVHITYKWEEKVIAWLHDVVEDTDITFGDLLNKGIPLDLVIVIELLTRKEDETFLENILRIKKSDIAITVKLADMAHNTSTSTKRHQKE